MKQKCIEQTVTGPEVREYLIARKPVNFWADDEDARTFGRRASRTFIRVQFVNEALAFYATRGQVLVLGRAAGMVTGRISNGILRYIILHTSIRAALRLLGPLNIASGRKVTRRRQSAGAKKWVPRPEMARSTGRVTGDTSIEVNVSRLDHAA
jgi:hypothetical protein